MFKAIKYKLLIDVNVESFKSLGSKPIAYSLLSLGASSNSGSGHSRKRHAFASFEGQMQQLIINSRSFFELLANGDVAATTPVVAALNTSATFSRPDLPHKYPLTFRSRHATWLALPKIDAHHLLMIAFHFKTSLDSPALIMFNRGLNDDFLAVELVDGQIVFSFAINKVSY